jgi:hypothetical protein
LKHETVSISTKKVIENSCNRYVDEDDENEQLGSIEPCRESRIDKIKEGIPSQSLTVVQLVSDMFSLSVRKSRCFLSTHCWH